VVESRTWPELAVALANMARELLSQGSVRETLDRVITLAVELVDGCESAGILVVRHGQVETVTATDDLVRAADRLQSELTEGPCFDATRNKHEVYRIADMTDADERWPGFAPRARALGIGSMMGFLLYTEGQDNLGALDLYSSKPGAFGRHHEQVGWLLASHAAVAWSSARHNEHLHAAIDTRQVIGEATGILMARYELTEIEAFGRLVQASQNTNTKLRDLARTITDTGSLPNGR
jgi:transcriptional regulator with GAF, ATPase, and Fis domain